MGWETKGGHRYYVIHRKQFGQKKPVYGGKGEAGVLAEQRVLEERAAFEAKLKAIDDFNGTEIF